MTKEQIFDFLNKEGITVTAVEYPNTSKEWVLEWLNKFDGSTLEDMPLDEFKSYYREFIEYNFK